MKRTDEQNRAIVDGLELVGPLLEASQKQGDRIIEAARQRDRKQAFIEGYDLGLQEGRRRQQQAFRQQLGLEGGECRDRMEAEDVWEKLHGEVG